MVRGWAAAARETGLSRFTLWRKVRDGSFPAPIELSANSIGWPLSEIEAWKASRPRRMYGGGAVHHAQSVSA
jgi:predicted DNA-binding transcriptional regulator AlpA